MSSNRLLLALTCGVPAICSAQFPRIRDSAGVHIVENSARAKAPIIFRASDKPSFDVGGLKDNLDDELDTKTYGALRSIALSNGTHVVNDVLRLRYFDAAGAQIRVSGRGGQGPGEFRGITALCHTRGDTVVTADQANGRVTIFDKSGSITREIPAGPLT